jgi:hypothetical protein
MCRKLLLSKFDDEELPDITDISSDDDAGLTMDPPPPPPVRSCLALLSNSRVSNLVQSTSVIAGIEREPNSIFQHLKHEHYQLYLNQNPKTTQERRPTKEKCDF